MLIALRIVFGLALLYKMMEGAIRAPDTISQAGDTTGAYYLVVCVTLGILNALVWAPYLGEKVSGPLTGMITQSNYVERTNWILRLTRGFDLRGYRRAALLMSFWEGVRHPNSPTPFAIGLKNARPGSWLEKVYAREVFRFNNTQNCLHAYNALKRHGITPRPHASQEVNIMLLSLERPPRPEAPVLAVPVAIPPAPIKRNPRIRLFGKAPGTMAENSSIAPSHPVSPAGEVRDLDEPGQKIQPHPEAHGRNAGPWFSNLLARVAAFLRAH